MRRAGLALLACLGFAGCFGSEEEQLADGADPTVGRAVTAKCEGIGPGPDWRRQAVDVGRFGLLGPQNLRFAHKIRNGNFVAKMGAVVVGHAPVTVRAPEAARGRIGFVYGDASRGRATQLTEAPVQVTFKPCPHLPRSGYVGGLLLDTIRESVALEIRLTDSRTELLSIGPAP